ncbi:MAG: HDIG domain-containing metalloprotein [Anaerolineales bacterium]
MNGVNLYPSPASPFLLRRILHGGIFLLTFLGTLIALLLPSLQNRLSAITPGEVAPRTVLAPYDIEYVSEVRTAEAREAAARSIAPIYTPPDPDLARRQLQRLREALQFISAVRQDTLATSEEKRVRLAGSAQIHLEEATIQTLLSLPDSSWERLQQEAITVLERTLRNRILEEDLPQVRQNLPGLVSLTLPREQAELVATLVAPFVIANSFYSPEMTEAARQQAREAVQPIVQRYKAGETIVAAGDVITPAQYEALQKLGLISSPRNWNQYFGPLAISLGLSLFALLYFSQRRQLPFLSSTRSVFLVALLFLLFLFGARLSIPDRAVLPYLYPLAALGITLTALFGMETGLLFSLFLSFLAAYGLPNTAELTPYYLLSSLMGVLALGNARRVWSFLLAGAMSAIGGVFALFAYRFSLPSTDWLGIVTLILAAWINGVAFSAGLALLFQYFLAQLLDLVTPMQLLEISRPDFPLLQYFLRHAPGTYQHSLQVANLAEQAAESIGADATLTRVGALFHDVGKALNAAFFIENQSPGQIDTHTDMPPEEAAAIIIRHVTDGVALARKHRLPRRIIDFILEHHGTMLTRFQYNQALERAGGDASKVDVNRFRYPGPRPRSRETAILMLADGVEARSRSLGVSNEEQLRALIQQVIEQALKEGQLDHAPLTMAELTRIAEAFFSTLRGLYHPRIQYPPAEVPLSSKSTDAP